MILADRQNWSQQDDDAAINTTQLRFLFNLPHLRHISGAVNDQEEDDLEPFEYPCRNSFMLSLDSSPLKPSTVRKIIAATPQLRHFDYRHQYHGDEEAPPFDCVKVVTDLKSVQDKLERLELVHHDWHPEVGDMMPSLASFTCLTRLKIVFVLLSPPADNHNIRFSHVLPYLLKFLGIIDRNIDYPISISHK